LLNCAVFLVAVRFFFNIFSYGQSD
jgi:hypothetical protein